MGYDQHRHAYHPPCQQCVAYVWIKGVPAKVYNNNQRIRLRSHSG